MSNPRGELAMMTSSKRHAWAVQEPRNYIFNGKLYSKRCAVPSALTSSQRYYMYYKCLR